MIRAILTAIFALALVPAALAGPGEADSALPPDFVGKVAYFGNYTGKSSVLVERSRGAKDIPCPYREHRCRTATVGGGVKVVLEFQGDRVIGFYYAVDGFRGPEGLKVGSLTGRRRNDGACELFQSDGSRWTGQCGSREFIGAISTDAGIPNAFDVRFNTLAMHIRDDGAIRRGRAEARRREGRIAALEARLASGSPQDKFYAAVELESYSWVPSGLDAERLGTPQWPTRFRRNRPIDVRSDFPLPGGGLGWVSVRYDGTDFACIASHRRPNCGPIDAPLPFRFDDVDEDREGWFTADGHVITDLRAAEPVKDR